MGPFVCGYPGQRDSPVQAARIRSAVPDLTAGTYFARRANCMAARHLVVRLPAGAAARLPAVSDVVVW
jgi:hypothetical protein